MVIDIQQVYHGPGEALQSWPFLHPLEWHRAQSCSCWLVGAAGSQAVPFKVPFIHVRHAGRAETVAVTQTCTE